MKMISSNHGNEDTCEEHLQLLLAEIVIRISPKKLSENFCIKIVYGVFWNNLQKLYFIGFILY